MSMFEEFVTDILKKEGGYVNDSNDAGGETNYGITIRTARLYGYTGPMKTLPLSVAKDIYKAKYWDSLNLDEVAKHSPAIAMIVGDIGVNMGIGRACEFFQRILNVMNNRGKHYPDLKVDGDLGPASVQAFKAYIAKRGSEGETVFVRALNCLRGAFYIQLAERRDTDETFVYGWLNRIF